jgi:HEAT repeat protein
VLTDLAQEGFNLEWISDLYSKKLNYKDAIPILMKWLPQIENLDVKEDIIRALSVRWAKPVAAKSLVAEFHKLQNESNTGIKWAIANALSVVANESVFIEIVELLRDPRHGKAREMLALSLGNMNDPRAQDVLINILADEEVAGHAIMVLGKLKSKKAYSAIEPFMLHPKTWVRKEARKALARIDKTSVNDILCR